MEPHLSISFTLSSSALFQDIFVEFEKNMTDIEEITKLVSEMLNTVDSNMTVMRNEDEDFLATSRVYSDLLPLATPLVGPSAVGLLSTSLLA